MIETKDKRDIYHRLATYKHDIVDVLVKIILLIYEGITEERLINLKRSTQTLMNHCDYVCSKIKQDPEQSEGNTNDN